MARARTAQKNGNGNGNGLHVVPNDDEEPVGEENYSSEDFNRFVERYRSNLGDVQAAQAEIRELYKEQTGKGMSKAGAQLALKLDAKIRNDKLAVNDAYGILETAMTMLDWMGYDEERRGDLVQRAEEESASPPV